MKNEQHEKARELYFQTDFSKSEIAEKLGVNRRTVMLWSQQGNWDKLKMSARHLPSLVAEKCYYLLDQFTSKLLIEGEEFTTITHKDADIINKLASCIKKIKNRSTVNESIEMFNFFMERIQKQDPDLATRVLPAVEDYIKSRSDVNTSDFLLDDFKPGGQLPFPDKKIIESEMDAMDTHVEIPWVYLPYIFNPKTPQIMFSQSVYSICKSPTGRRFCKKKFKAPIKSAFND